MKTLITIIVILGVISAGVAGYLWYRRSQMPDPQDAILRTDDVRRGDLPITVPASGKVAARERVNLSFTASGEIAEVNVKVGDRVKEGQVLASLDTLDLDIAVRKAEVTLALAELSLASLRQPADAGDVAVAEGAVNSAAQSLAVARASKTAAEAQAAFSNRLAMEARDRTEEAYQNYLDFLDKYGLPAAYAAGINVAYLEAEGNVGITFAKTEYQIQQAQSQWLSAYQAFKQAEQSLQRLQEGVDEERIRQAELQIEQAQLGLEQAQARLDQSVIVAPFDGIVAAVTIQQRTLAVSGVPAITVLDDAALYIDVTVDEIDIGAIAEGQPVDITLDAYATAVLTGTVERVAALPSNAGGIIAYTLRVGLADAGDTDVREGMTANVVILTNTLNDVLLVPNWAIRTDQTTNETYVYRIENSVPVRQVITTGARNDTHTVILSGLDEGATVALVTETRSLFDFQGPPPGMR